MKTHGEIMIKMKTRRTDQSGSSLLEALISAFVLAFGILGIAGTQTSALRSNQGALEQSSVVFLTHSIFDAMRASMEPAGKSEGDLSELVVRVGYDTTGQGKNGFLCKASDVSASDPLVANDLKNWINSINANLNIGDSKNPACGKITCESADANLCTVTIQWNNSRAKGGSNTQTVENRSRL
jgi:type IV pilus assembly protein PilV